MITLIKKHTRTASTTIIVSLFSLSLWQLATAGWIQGKAIVAQQLLKNSWHQTLDNKKLNHKFVAHKPWPWADTWPVAKIIVPQHDIEQIILAGDSGSSLAFGPGYAFASARPNTDGTTMISAHRDTHFSFLKELQLNDKIYLQTPDKTLRYQVDELRIVDSSNFTLQVKTDEAVLVLVTCYPFNASNAGGSLRYLVFATPETDSRII